MTVPTKFTIWKEFPKYIDGTEEYDDEYNIIGGEPQDFSGDYEGVVVELYDFEFVHKLAEFGDHYHYKGYDKAEAFIEGYAKAKGWKENIHYVVETDYRVDKNYG